VRITGVDVRTLDDTAIATIRSSAVEHVVVVIPGQFLGPAEQVAFSRRFGPAGEVPFIEPLAGHPEVIAVVKEAVDGEASNFGGVWHSDFSFQRCPPSFTFLQAHTVPFLRHCRVERGRFPFASLASSPPFDPRALHRPSSVVGRRSRHLGQPQLTAFRDERLRGSDAPDVSHDLLRVDP
jgi:alpha-ketoglutarate-dependent taurine dioxygenase